MTLGRISKTDAADAATRRRLLAVWESSVRATHDFLTEEDILALRPEVENGIKYIERLYCFYDENNVIQGFIGVVADKIEMLFVDALSRGCGIGKALVDQAINVLDVKYVDVNEQNPQGIGFYEKAGFKTFSRSDLDAQSKPFPILHMKIF